MLALPIEDMETQYTPTSAATVWVGLGETISTSLVSEEKPGHLAYVYFATMMVIASVLKNQLWQRDYDDNSDGDSDSDSDGFNDGISDGYFL